MSRPAECKLLCEHCDNYIDEGEDIEMCSDCDEWVHEDHVRECPHAPKAVQPAQPGPAIKPGMWAVYDYTDNDYPFPVWVVAVEGRYATVRVFRRSGIDTVLLSDLFPLPPGGPGSEAGGKP